MKDHFKALKKLVVITALAAVATIGAHAQQVAPRWGYLSMATNIAGTTTITAPTNDVAAYNAATGKTNAFLNVFRDRGVTLWTTISPTNNASTSSNCVITINTTPNGTTYGTGDIVWTIPYQGTNSFTARTNLTKEVLGQIKGLRWSTIQNGWSNTVPIGPLLWSITP